MWLSQGDGWLSQGDGWLSQGDGWLSQGIWKAKTGRCVAKQKICPYKLKPEIVKLNFIRIFFPFPQVAACPERTYSQRSAPRQRQPTC
jgi:hypothetical protein